MRSSANTLKTEDGTVSSGQRKESPLPLPCPLLLALAQVWRDGSGHGGAAAQQRAGKGTAASA